MERGRRDVGGKTVRVDGCGGIGRRVGRGRREGTRDGWIE